MFKIADKTVKEPKGVTVVISDLDGDSKRNAVGKMHRDRIKGGANALRALNVEWGPMSTAEMKTILQACGAEEFSITYLDPYTGANRTATFYVGDRTAPVYSYNEKFKKIIWTGLTCSFIEIG